MGCLILISKSADGHRSPSAINLMWQGRQGSNLRMTGSKPVALPLGDAPINSTRYKFTVG
jgi:hypothetical protein